MDTMFKILAILGSLAWVPQIIIFFREFMIKPKLKIIPDNQLEIGYTTFGPIINTRVAFLSENKKSLIEKIELELTHENNDSQRFTWKWFEETLYIVDLPNQAGSMPTKKNQTAIAINLIKDDLIEKKIGFQQNTFQTEKKILEQGTVEDAINFDSANKEKDELKATKNYNDLLAIYKNGFNWKVGKYSLKYKIYVTGMKSPFEKVVYFRMTSLDINYLKTNIEMCINDTERTYFNSELPLQSWNWAYMSISESL